MTPSKLIFVALILCGSLAACKEKPAEKPDTTKSDDVQILSQHVTSITGSWTGLFEPDHQTFLLDKTGDSVPVSANKITLFITNLSRGKISGYSVCAGNERPFSGMYEEEEGGDKLKVSMQEPGDNKYDGVFDLVISKRERTLTGKWTPFNKTLVGRHYTLRRKNFTYNATSGMHPEASMRLLTADDVNNAYKEELRYMRNEIYARHGYSFKLRETREMFEDQAWYMPVSNDVRTKLSAIEVKNEKLIKSFEKYAEESYDDYGR
ncbi:YARHG domain-containing protein [Longitalea arenae]|uniref:YARHG domain-containing protein n=1 Tax=Longitalea arenae TaxID=2812558 RepID=UPI001966D291|nr:YARHG domain-containing protein [Longitalea arenae]